MVKKTWYLKEHGDLFSIHNIEMDEPIDDRNEICRFKNKNNETLENAKIMAAAPEMLSELIKVYNTMVNTQEKCYWEPIKSVINKAIIGG